MYYMTEKIANAQALIWTAALAHPITIKEVSQSYAKLIYRTVVIIQTWEQAT